MEPRYGLTVDWCRPSPKWIDARAGIRGRHASVQAAIQVSYLGIDGQAVGTFAERKMRWDLSLPSSSTSSTEEIEITSAKIGVAPSSQVILRGLGVRQLDRIYGVAHDAWINVPFERNVMIVPVLVLPGVISIQTRLA
ncbi:hypothetical protein Q9L58_010846, partial [Maublancomyces gigas]